MKSEIASLKTEASQTTDQITDLKLPAGLSVKNGKYLCPTNKKTFARVQFYGMQSCDKFFEGMKASENNSEIIINSNWYELPGESSAELSQIEAIQTYQKAPSPPKGIRMFVITNQAKQYSVTSFFTPLKPEGVSSADTDPNTRTSVYLLNPIQKNKD